MSVSAFDHGFLAKLLGDEEVAGYFSVDCDLQAMLRFELALVKASAALGVVPHEASEEIALRLADFRPDLAQLNEATARDGVVIPNLIAQMRDGLPEEFRHHLHYGATSQDVIDTSLMLRLTKVLLLFKARAQAICDLLADLEMRFGDRPLMAHTRMQAALEIKVADRLKSWKLPLLAYREEIAAMLTHGLPVQFGGAVGTLEKFGDKGPALRRGLALELELCDREQWHSQRGIITDIGHLCARFSGSLGKLGQDVALMAQDASEIGLSGGGTSSAMAHKQNPVAAEALVAQARFTATLVSGLYHSQIHEQERSGAAWTLEWMVLPQVVVSCGASMSLTLKLLQSIIRLG